MSSNMNYTDLSREEKERLAQECMDKMKLKNDLLKRRHAEVECDRRAAEKQNSAVTNAPKAVKKEPSSNITESYNVQGKHQREWDRGKLDKDNWRSTENHDPFKSFKTAYHRRDYEQAPEASFDNKSNNHNAWQRGGSSRGHRLRTSDRRDTSDAFCRNRNSDSYRHGYTLDSRMKSKQESRYKQHDSHYDDSAVGNKFFKNQRSFNKTSSFVRANARNRGNDDNWGNAAGQSDVKWSLSDEEMNIMKSEVETSRTKKCDAWNENEFPSAKKVEERISASNYKIQKQDNNGGHGLRLGSDRRDKRGNFHQNKSSDSYRFDHTSHSRMKSKQEFRYNQFDSSAMGIKSLKNEGPFKKTSNFVNASTLNKGNDNGIKSLKNEGPLKKTSNFVNASTLNKGNDNNLGHVIEKSHKDDGLWDTADQSDVKWALSDEETEFMKSEIETSRTKKCESWIDKEFTCDKEIDGKISVKNLKIQDEDNNENKTGTGSDDSWITEEGEINSDEGANKG